MSANYIPRGNARALEQQGWCINWNRVGHFEDDTPARQGCSWTDAENKGLIHRYTYGMAISRIAYEHYRSEYSITCQLKKLGFDLDAAARPELTHIHALQKIAYAPINRNQMRALARKALGAKPHEAIDDIRDKGTQPENLPRDNYLVRITPQDDGTHYVEVKVHESGTTHAFVIPKEPKPKPEYLDIPKCLRAQPIKGQDAITPRGLGMVVDWQWFNDEIHSIRVKLYCGGVEMDFARDNVELIDPRR